MNNVQIIIDYKICSGCCSCLSICPEGVIAFVYDKESGHPIPYIMQKDCTNCGFCLSRCPSNLMLASIR